MTDYRSMFDSEYVGAWDLPKDATVTIARVTPGNIVGSAGRKAKKPIVYFEGREKGLIVNKTNGKTIAGMYGPVVEEWIGKRITLYATETQMGSETMQCIRVRPTIPNGKSARKETEKPAEPMPSCPECEGSGKVSGVECGVCFGSGHV